MSLKRKYDAVVVGAGPAGAAAARVMVEAGLSVLVIERKKLPRYKICSGLINEKSLKLTRKYFGEIPDECYCRPRIIKGVRLWYDAERNRDWPFGEKGAPNVWRAQYDEWLVRRSGAEVMDMCLLTDFKMEDDKVRL
ncbi:MAG: NAD(P)/FAD-dependent oxidoreductase, partial [Planctomycetota bacterium]